MRCLVVLALIASGATGQAGAGGLEDARQRGKLLVGVKSDFPPFGFFDQSGALCGFDVDVARYLARALFNDPGEKLDLVSVTSGSRIPSLYSGRIDVIVASMTITGEREQVLEFSDPYFLSGSMILVLQESAISDIKDLARKRIAVLEGSVQQKDLEQIVPQAIRIRFATLGEALEALKKKIVDVVCTDDVAALFLAQRDKTLKAVGTSFNPHPYAIAVRRGETDFLKWINRQLSKMKEEGTYEELWRKYLDEGDYERLWYKNPG
jgi:putative glutamine transport system substrate-binding protein